jgi:hypothetical protein
MQSSALRANTRFSGRILRTILGRMTLSLLPSLLLLTLPFDAADRIFGLRWRRRLSRSLELLCALAGDLKKIVTRHRLDQEPTPTTNASRRGK